MTNTDAEKKTERKKPGRPITIDYEKSFADQSRCPSCKCITTPEDYKHRNIEGKIVKTCFKCRDSVLKCMGKRDIKPRQKMKTKIAMYQKIIDLLPSEQIEKLISENEGLFLPDRV